MTPLELAGLFIQSGVGLVMVAFGLHQLVNPVAWQHYIPGWLARLLPVSTNMFMRLHGAGNFILGALLILGLWLGVISWVVVGWWVSILPFAFYADWRIGLRDLAIVGALCSLGLQQLV